MINCLKSIRTALAGVTATTLLILATMSAHSHADSFDGRVNVWNSPLNVRDCGSSSCQRVGRLLRDEGHTFNGRHSSSRWLEITNLDGNPHAYDFVYGRYIREGGSSLGTTYSRSYQATTTATLNLREGPMYQYDLITRIPKGATITVRGDNGHYLDVYWRPDLHQFTSPIYGYVHSAYVKRQ